MSIHGILRPENLCQIAFLVPDIQAAAAQWARLLGQDPPTPIETAGYDQAHTLYRGQPSNARARLAFFTQGPLAIELIQPIDDTPSVWREGLTSTSPSIHHLAFRVSDMDQALQAFKNLGCPVIQQGDFPGGCYAYIDTRPLLGILIELLATSRGR